MVFPEAAEVDQEETEPLGARKDIVVAARGRMPGPLVRTVFVSRLRNVSKNAVRVDLTAIAPERVLKELFLEASEAKRSDWKEFPAFERLAAALPLGNRRLPPLLFRYFRAMRRRGFRAAASAAESLDRRSVDKLLGSGCSGAVFACGDSSVAKLFYPDGEPDGRADRFYRLCAENPEEPVLPRVLRYFPGRLVVMERLRTELFECKVFAEALKTAKVRLVKIPDDGEHDPDDEWTWEEEKLVKVLGVENLGISGYVRWKDGADFIDVFGNPGRYDMWGNESSMEYVRAKPEGLTSQETSRKLNW